MIIFANGKEHFTTRKNIENVYRRQMTVHCIWLNACECVYSTHFVTSTIFYLCVCDINMYSSIAFSSLVLTFATVLLHTLSLLFPLRRRNQAQALSINISDGKSHAPKDTTPANKKEMLHRPLKKLAANFSRRDMFAIQNLKISRRQLSVTNFSTNS